MKIGITGVNGFLGYHLEKSILLMPELEVVGFRRDYFENDGLMHEFVNNCDVIVHLAGLNRSENEEEIYHTNVGIANSLVQALKNVVGKPPHVLFSSSTQEDRGNLYGNSKKEARELINEWAVSSGGLSTGLLIPNVFGPFGKPFYNSVVATFCHQVATGETPTIINDGEVSLVYVLDLVQEIISLIEFPNSVPRENGVSKVSISARDTVLVSELLNKIKGFKEVYLNDLGFPNLMSAFDKALFNTFRCYVPKDFYPKKFVKFEDDRGCFVEIARTDTSGQTSYSSTVPGVTRGNHYHTRKAERFAVIKGEARIQVRKIGTNEVVEYCLNGKEPAFVDMPIWHTHNITNIGKDELLTIFWINEPYNEMDPDTYFENV